VWGELVNVHYTSSGKRKLSVCLGRPPKPGLFSSCSHNFWGRWQEDIWGPPTPFITYFITLLALLGVSAQQKKAEAHRGTSDSHLDKAAWTASLGHRVCYVSAHTAQQGGCNQKHSVWEEWVPQSRSLPTVSLKQAFSTPALQMFWARYRLTCAV
jgi:hypothetical protein